MIDDSHKLDYLGKTDDPLIYKMVNRLIRAAADEQVRKNMDVEDEVENTIANLLREKDEIIDKKDKALEQKDKALEQKDKVLEQKDKVLEQKDKVLSEQNKLLAEQAAFIEELRKKLSDNKPE